MSDINKGIPLMKPTFFYDNDPNNPKKKTFIEREALLKEFDEIEPDECYDDEHDMWLDCRLSAIQAPTADVVKVVRCMHCIHFKASINKEHYCDIHSSVWDKFYVRVDDFCSYGERKDK